MAYAIVYIEPVDAIAAMLDGPRAQGAFLLRCVLAAPWSLLVGDEAPLSLIAVTRGRAWVTHDGSAPVALDRGDLALVRGPDHYTLSDEPVRPPQVRIDPDQSCHSLDGRPLGLALSLGVRTWGNGGSGGEAAADTVFLTGCYGLASQVSPRVLDALPRLVVIPARDWSTPLPAVLEAELEKTATGQQVVLDRLLDLLLIEALRVWFARPGGGSPLWWAAAADPVLGPALRAMHDEPARPWTVAGLAATSGLSRAAFARRFTEAVGEPPLAYLTGWRLAMAADALRGTDATLTAVARSVGYSTPFALSTAFKRRYGLSPERYRRDLPPRWNQPSGMP